MHARVVLGVGKGVLFREVSSVQECPHKERGSTVLIVHSVFDTMVRTAHCRYTNHHLREEVPAGQVSLREGRTLAAVL